MLVMAEINLKRCCLIWENIRDCFWELIVDGKNRSSFESFLGMNLSSSEFLPYFGQCHSLNGGLDFFVSSSCLGKQLIPREDNVCHTSLSSTTIKALLAVTVLDVGFIIY